MQNSDIHLFRIVFRIFRNALMSGNGQKKSENSQYRKKGKERRSSWVDINKITKNYNVRSQRLCILMGMCALKDS